MIEIELKFEIKSVPKVLMEMTPVKNKTQVDIYYDTPDYKQIQRGRFLRVRNGARMDFKGDFSCGEIQHDYCNEVSFDIDKISDKSKEINNLFNASGMNVSGTYKDFDDMLNQNNLKVLSIIDKKRCEYKIKENITIALDDAKDIGLFLEAEIMAPENTSKDDIKKYIEQIHQDLTDCEILESDAKQVGIGYVELYLKKHNRSAYDLGLYKE